MTITTKYDTGDKVRTHDGVIGRVRTVLIDIRITAEGQQGGITYTVAQLDNHFRQLGAFDESELEPVEQSGPPPGAA